MWLQFEFEIFKQKEIGIKADCQMFVKLTTGVHFTNILRAAFVFVYPKNIKNAVKSSVSFYTFGLHMHES